MQTVIVRICKNKNGDKTDAGRYRPTSLATIISTLCEHYILSCISPILATADNQFGFKPKHGTNMCIYFTLTDCVLLCKQRYCSVYFFFRCI